MRLALAKFPENLFALSHGRDPCIDQGVDHPGHCFGDFIRIFAGKINFARVCVLVPRDSARLGNLLEGRRDSDLLDLFVKYLGLVKAFYILISPYQSAIISRQTRKSAQAARGDRLIII